MTFRAKKKVRNLVMVTKVYVSEIHWYKLQQTVVSFVDTTK